MYLGPKHKTKALLRTFIVFGVLLFILLWIKMSIPNPPFSEGGGGPGMGLEVNLGISDEGMGDNQMPDPINISDFKEEKAAPVPEDAEKIITDESEESESIKSAEKKENTEVKKPEKKIKKKKEIVKPEKEVNKVASEEIATPKINQKAMFPAKKNVSNEGTTNKAGDQGNANGIAGSPLYKGGGNGSGGGTGGGSGTGTGTDNGNGISFSLNGRTPNYLPKPDFNEQIEGKVVVEITVDKNGKVISAVPGKKGSTTNEESLLDAAKKAALLSKFNKKPDATIQKGTITYHFLLQ